jgi:uncharacterized protein (TIGR00730 family)
MRGELRRICVYCGSNPGRDARYGEAAEAVGRDLASRGIGVVYGGGDVGLMGTVADAAMRAGGEVVGVIPKALVDREIGHRGLTELHVVGSMHERKLLMADLADAFVALPGGVGTLEELIEVFTWTQLGLHRKPCAVLDVGGYYQHLIAFLDHAVSEGFLTPEHRGTLLEVGEPEDLVPAFEAWEPVEAAKWIDRRES